MQQRVSFGMIVLNGEPFIRYNLRALYPFAHQIIVVEGAVLGNDDNADENGHSLDGTLESLMQFKRDEDPDNKLILVTRDNFWSEKDEMSQAYASRATGDFLWQIDSDEFYMPQDMQTVLTMLRDDPRITAVTLPERVFWGAPQYVAESWFLRTFVNGHRLFKWGEGYRYQKHRPPTVLNAQGVNLRTIQPVSQKQMRQRNIYMYHYSHLFPKQVIRKSAYYSRVSWENFAGMNEWAQKGYLQLKWRFHVHNVYKSPSWLVRYQGNHPPQVLAMWHDIEAGRIAVERRQTEDVERLLTNCWYTIGRSVVKYADYGVDIWRFVRRLPRRTVEKIHYEIRKRHA